MFRKCVVVTSRNKKNLVYMPTTMIGHIIRASQIVVYSLSCNSWKNVDDYVHDNNLVELEYVRRCFFRWVSVLHVSGWSVLLVDVFSYGG